MNIFIIYKIIKKINKYFFYKIIFLFKKIILYIIFIIFKIKIILFFIIIKFLFIELFYISSNSMNPTLYSGDIILVNKIYNIKFFIFNKIFKINEIKKNDIIVFKYPFNTKINFIKRITGIPGENILIKKNNNITFYINKKSYIIDKKYEIIKNNFYFVSGDNKNISFDSRYWGLLNKKYIIGKAIYKIVNINLNNNKKKIRFIFKKIE